MCLHSPTPTQVPLFAPPSADAPLGMDMGHGMGLPSTQHESSHGGMGGMAMGLGIDLPTPDSTCLHQHMGLGGLGCGLLPSPHSGQGYEWPVASPSHSCPHEITGPWHRWVRVGASQWVVGLVA